MGLLAVIALLAVLGVLLVALALERGISSDLGECGLEAAPFCPSRLR